MTGFDSKRRSSAIRWLGPYAPADRHADDVTVAELVRLRVENETLKQKLAEAEMCACRKREWEIVKLFDELNEERSR